MKKPLIITIMMLLILPIAYGQIIDSATDVFNSLDVNDDRGFAEFTMDSPVALTKSKLSFRFIEVYGKVLDYRVQILDQCTEYVDVYADNETCDTLKNGTLECTRELLRSDTISVDCWKTVDSIPAGTNKYRLDADLEVATRPDGTRGYEIDWIPELTHNSLTYTRTEWAWWNKTFDDTRIFEYYDDFSSNSGDWTYSGSGNSYDSTNDELDWRAHREATGYYATLNLSEFDIENNGYDFIMDMDLKVTSHDSWAYNYMGCAERNFMWHQQNNWNYDFIGIILQRFDSSGTRLQVRCTDSSGNLAYVHVMDYVLNTAHDVYIEYNAENMTVDYDIAGNTGVLNISTCTALDQPLNYCGSLDSYASGGGPSMYGSIDNFNLSIFNDTIIPDANEEEGDEAIEEGMNDALSSPIIYEDMQIIVANTTHQSLGRYDKIAIDDDQIFAANYITENETYQNQTDLGTFVMFKEMASKTYSEIVSEVSSWISGLLN